MNFLVDAQQPPTLAKSLISQGYVASHVFDIGLERADDRTIWNRAIEIRAVIVTKDEDFAIRKILEANGPRIVWIRFGNTTLPEVLRRFGQHLPGVLGALQRGEGLVEID